MTTFVTPGVCRQEAVPPRATELATGVPAFLGFTAKGDSNAPARLTLWPQLATAFGPPRAGGYLAAAVRGFFENAGRECWVVRLDDTLDPPVALRRGLAALAPRDDLDLVCAPDVMRGADGDPAARATALEMQTAILEHCAVAGDRFALLDALPGATVDGVLAQAGALAATGGAAYPATGAGGALYHPWLRTRGGGPWIPPCGHVAGTVAGGDRRTGVHQAPANQPLDGVLDLRALLSDAEQSRLQRPPAAVNVNALRAFPGRGIRVWGARTLCSADQPEWTYVNVRRLFLTVRRWIDRHLAGVAFEPHDVFLWARIERQLGSYFTDLFQRGALRGASAEEAFFVKCDAETNPPEVREAGRVVTEIGLAPVVPGEWIVVRLIHGSAGVSFA